MVTISSNFVTNSSSIVYNVRFPSASYHSEEIKRKIDILYQQFVKGKPKPLKKAFKQYVDALVENNFDAEIQTFDSSSVSMEAFRMFVEFVKCLATQLNINYEVERII